MPTMQDVKVGDIIKTIYRSGWRMRVLQVQTALDTRAPEAFIGLSVNNRQFEISSDLFAYVCSDEDAADFFNH